LRGCFVTGTDTGVGKTVVSAAIVAVLRARRASVRALKPVISGLDAPPDPVWPPDHALLASLTGQSPDEVAPIRFGPAVSPHLAAELAGAPLDPDAIARAVVDAQDAAQRAHADALVIEGVGGLLVPFVDAYAVRDLARELALPVVVVARPGLGTINHTLLTLEAARAAGVQVARVVLNPFPAEPDAVRALQPRHDRAPRPDRGLHAGSRRALPDAAFLAAAGAALGVDRLIG
jgi:dethiobiotin synthetase